MPACHAPSVPGEFRAAATSLRQAMGNPGIRRLLLGWTFGIAADTALFVVLLVVAYSRDGILGTGLLGAARMGPAVVAGALSGAALRRWPGRRILVAMAFVRAGAAVAAAVAIGLGAPTAVLLLAAAVAGGAGAFVRPIQATLMPALATTPDELIAANVAWGFGEGLGSFGGPALASALMALGDRPAVALAAAIGFGVTGAIVVGLRFEQARDARAGRIDQPGGGAEFVRGLRVLRRRPVAAWSTVGVFGQTLTRGLLSGLIVVASVELLGLGDPGVGSLNAAMGIGGLVAGVFAMSLVRPANLLASQAVTLAFWGLPIAVLGLVPVPIVAFGAMAVIGLSNAAYDAAAFTIFQRGCSNDERGAVFAVFETVAGLGVVAGSLLAPVLLGVFGNREGIVVAGAFLPIIAVVVYGQTVRAGALSTVPEQSVALLRSVAAFAALPLTAIERLAEAAQPASYAAGEAVMRQGEPGDRFLVIERGEVNVFVDGQFVQRLGRGDGIGEVALLRRTPRTATIVATSEVAAVSIGALDFCTAVSGPRAGALMEQLARQHLGRAGGTA